MEEEPPGLSTREALTRLHDELSSVVQEHLLSQKWHQWRTVVLEAFGHHSQLSVFRWPALLVVLLAGTAFIVAGCLHDPSVRFSCLTGVGVLLLFLCTFNAVIVLREAWLRHSEMTMLASELLALLKSEIPLTQWEASHYPHKHSPQSPCISLQWSVRDGKVVNLPAALLVAGDTVMLRPGQKLVADCVPLGPKYEPLTEATPLLTGSMYSSPGESLSGEALTSPKVRLPIVPKAHRVLRTPFVPVLRALLQEAAQRPVSVHQKQRNVVAWGMEAILVPVLLVVCVLISCTRLYYGVWCNTAPSVHLLYTSLSYNSSHNLSSQSLSAEDFVSGDASGVVLDLPYGITNIPIDDNNTSFFTRVTAIAEQGMRSGDVVEAILVVPFCVVLPLLPLLLPLLWCAYTIVSSSVVLALHGARGKGGKGTGIDANSDASRKRRRSGDSDGSDGHDSARLCPPDPPSAGEDESRGSDSPKLGAVQWSLVLQHAIQLLQGHPSSCVRSSNLVHVLSSLTNLCCVDKKGILSWANPTAEKLFFLRNRAAPHGPPSDHPAPSAAAPKTRPNHHASTGSLDGDEDAAGEPLLNLSDGADVAAPADSAPAQHDFSDHMPSPVESEPVLLSLTHDHATPFGLTFDEPLWRDFLGSLKPLGLSVLLNTCHPDTQAHYTAFCGHLTNEAAYTQDLVPVSQRRCLCELARQMGFSLTAQDPFVLEHQLSVFRHVPSELASKGRLARSLMVSKLKFPFPHLVSVLMRDTATHKLELLTQGTADIVLDSCADYWDGSDLTPLTDKDRKKLLDFYHRTSLSAYCTAFSYRPSPCVVNTELTRLYMELPTDPTHLYTRSPTPYNSTEALFGDEAHTEYEEVNDVDDLFHMQCKQIFIGMVTMQYQAKVDMVQLIEQLESSCIRFVHFSKENELRSRVFSEKMGLESGWNCHISLLDDKKSGAEAALGSCHTSVRASKMSLNRCSREDFHTTALPHPRPKASQRSKSLKRRLAPGRSSALQSMKALSYSAPAAINTETSLVKFEDDASSVMSSQSSGLDRHMRSICDLDYRGCVVAVGDGFTHPSSLQPVTYAPNSSPIHSHHSYSPRHRHLSPLHKSSGRSHPVTSAYYSPQSPRALFRSYGLSQTQVQSCSRGQDCHNQGCEFSNCLRCPEVGQQNTEGTVTIDIDRAPPDMHENVHPSCVDDRLLKSPLKEAHSFEMGSSCNNSHTSESSEHSTCFNFDMSNRARLPKGINNIRPHLKDVDNVPLLVSLFTDCTASATQQMLEIMQENGEVVLLMGSSANLDNVPLFVRTDASVGVEPLYPVVCMRERVHDTPPCLLSPTGLATRLHGLPTALHFASSPLGLVPLIEKARHLAQMSTNCLQFWAAAGCSLTLLQLLALLALLPPALHTADVAFLLLVTLPLLALSLAAAPHNSAVMRVATGKNALEPHSQLLRYVCSHYGAKFLPSVLVLLLCVCLTLRSSCLASGGPLTAEGSLPADSLLTADELLIADIPLTTDDSSTLDSPFIADSPYIADSPSTTDGFLTADGAVIADSPLTVDGHLAADNLDLTPVADHPLSYATQPPLGGGEESATPVAQEESSSVKRSSVECFYVYRVVYDEQGTRRFVGWGADFAQSIRVVQSCTAFVFLLYMCVVSVSFVHRMSQVWQTNPFTNVVWAATVLSVLVVQLAYTWAVCGSLTEAGGGGGVSNLPQEAWLIALIWSLVLLPINELFKRREIRANVRYQKRARLEFGTKLGMNSPF